MRDRTSRRLNADRTSRRLGVVLTAVLLVTLSLSMGAVGYLVLAADHANEPHTELSLLGPNGTAEEYPETLSVGETGEARLRVQNNRYEAATYTLVTSYGDRTVTQNLSVPAQDSWETSVSVTPSEPGREPLRGSLYAGTNTTGEADWYVVLWVTASE